MKILVFGFFNKDNLGDELFKEAFKHLFPEFDLYFTDYITIELLKNKDAIFIGGGSFLDQNPTIQEGALIPLAKIPLFYIGIGAETTIHETHKNLMRRAKLIAIRSPHLDKIKEINENVIEIPDIVYSLASKINNKNKIDKSILYIPNSLLLPKWNDPHWKHMSWSYWKLEIAQTFDYLIENGYIISTYPMSINVKSNDNDAALEIFNMMHCNDRVLKLDPYNFNEFDKIISLFSRFSTIISQRYHGSILAEMAGAPYISIAHHDKLKQTYYNYGSFTSYFETSKSKLLNEIKNSYNQKIIPIDTNIFDGLVDLVNKCLNGLPIKINK